MKARIFKSQYFLWRRELEETIDQWLTSHKLEHSINKSWTLKEIIAHINWYDREMIELLKTREFRGSEYWALPLNERNERIRADSERLKPKEVLSQFQTNSKELKGLIRELTNEDLINAEQFREMPSKWVPWQVLMGNLQDHYKDHLQVIKTPNSHNL